MRETAGLGIPLFVLAVLASGCSSQPEIYRAESSGDGTTLHFEMNACNGDYAVAVEQDTGQVGISITDQRRRTPFSRGDDCADVVGPIRLDSPLGDRRLVDAAHNVPIPVIYEPWNQQKYSEADYFDAVESAARCIEERDPEAIVRIGRDSDGFPDVDVSLPDLGDGESRQNDAVPVCIAQHIDPLRE